MCIIEMIVLYICLNQTSKNPLEVLKTLSRTTKFQNIFKTIISNFLGTKADPLSDGSLSALSDPAQPCTKTPSQPLPGTQVFKVISTGFVFQKMSISKLQKERTLSTKERTMKQFTFSTSSILEFCKQA